MDNRNNTGFEFIQDVEKSNTLDAFEADRSIVELKEEIGHGEFGRYVLQDKLMMFYNGGQACIVINSSEIPQSNERCG